ncbi:flavin reductase family protein [Acidobacteriota bacterium]
MDTETRKKVLQKVNNGVFIVSSHMGTEFNGMVASWVSQVSFAPPLVMIAVAKNRYSHDLIKNEGSFVVNVVGRDSAELVNSFSSPGNTMRFEGIPFFTRETGSPILEAAIAYAECKTVQTVECGDHSLFIGEVVGAELLKDEPPLQLEHLGISYEGFSGS